MEPDVTISNGFAFSPDGSRAYYNDTPTGRTDVFDRRADGSLEHRRPFFAHEGNPDGLCVDAEGYVWVAMWGASAVHRISPDGKLDGIVHVPCTHVSACTFGGADLGTLSSPRRRTTSRPAPSRRPGRCSPSGPASPAFLRSPSAAEKKFFMSTWGAGIPHDVRAM